jgi:hypothetical protein
MKNRFTNLQFIGLLLALVVLQPTEIAVAQNGQSKDKCERTKQKIAKIHSKMRQGYTASQGVRMDEELRRLKKLRSKYCR